MKLNFEVKNFGKIQHAKLKLGAFSVVSGSNSSGKSFVTRALYSYFSTINKDYITTEMLLSLNQIDELMRHGMYVTTAPSNNVIDLFYGCNSSLEEIKNSIKADFQECTFLQQSTRMILLEKRLLDFEKNITFFLAEVDGKKKYFNLNENLEIINIHLKQMKNIIKNPIDFLSHKYSIGFSESLKENFQVANLIDLHSNTIDMDSPISFNFGDLGNLSIKKENVNLKLNGSAIEEFQSLYNVVFIESPIYWKLRKPLQMLREFPFVRVRRLNREALGLTGVPKYFYDLMDLLSQNIKSSYNSSELFELYNNIIKHLGGELDLSDSGDLMFKDAASQQNISLNLTATGVTNLGLIALLLKKNVISEGSFVFIDEPEVNLHPAWQKIMIETLYQLSLKGINVVIASHSIDMMKYIENIMNKLSDNEIEKHFAINHLSRNGKSLDENLSAKQTLIKIKEDLGLPFYEMMLENEW